MPAFCQHSRKPLRPLASVYSALQGLKQAEDFAISEDGVVYYLKARSMDYGPDYFLGEYESQYGKSYLDDEANLRRLARSRLDWMESVIVSSRHTVDWPAEGPDLLEIGSATGFFLDEAKERGFRTLGVEISGFASEFARNRGHSVIQSSFVSADLMRAVAELLPPSPLSQSQARGPGSENQRPAGLDLIAAFYTLEHFPDQQLAFKRISQLMKPGGILLLALPSYHGPLFRCGPEKWLATHPSDHFADYSPESLALTLHRYGLKLLSSRPSSFHPERACGWLRYMPKRWYRNWSLKHSFGDTMEALAIRID